MFVPTVLSSSLSACPAFSVSSFVLTSSTISLTAS